MIGHWASEMGATKADLAKMALCTTLHECFSGSCGSNRGTEAVRGASATNIAWC